MVIRLAGLLTLAALLCVVGPVVAKTHEILVTAEGFEPAEMTIQKGRTGLSVLRSKSPELSRSRT